MKMKLIFTTVLAACTPEDPLDGLVLVASDPSDAPIDGLDADWQARFDRGDVLFEEVFRDTTGLGPAYIRQSCASCHADDARGPGVVEKFVQVEEDGITPKADQSALPWGHTSRPHVAGGGITPIVAPDLPDLLLTTRSPNAVFGRGYVEAVRDDEIERVAAEQALRDDGISGRVQRVDWQSEANPDARFHPYGPGDEGLIGRFGLKGRIATVDEFVADAYQGDMSITSPLRPTELPNPDGLDDDALKGLDVDTDTVNLVADYVRLLAIPSREEVDGDALFAQVGCDVCHVPALRTRADYPVPQLADIDAPIYSDLLLHDMGVADGLVDGIAGTSEWRTAPLMGLRHLRAYLHDGAAGTVEEAVLLHEAEGSEANDALAAWRALPAEGRSTLLTFVESL